MAVTIAKEAEQGRPLLLLGLEKILLCVCVRKGVLIKPRADHYRTKQILYPFIHPHEHEQPTHLHAHGRTTRQRALEEQPRQRY